MKFLLLSLFVSTVFLQASAQELFPEKCLGTWRGTMHIWQQGHLRDSVPVVFTVKALGAESWTWKTEYLSKNMPMTKDYVLRLKDREKLIFITDEGDGVQLTDYQMGDELYSVFETAGFLLTARYERQGETLVFEVSSGKKQDPPVKDITVYSTTSVQRVVLVRDR